MYVTDLKTTEEQEVMIPDSPGRVTVKWMLTEAKGAPNFELRYFSLTGGAQTEWHAHPWEHEVFVVKGSGAVSYEGGEHLLEAGSSVLVLPEEMHRFKQRGDQPFDFICIVPKGTLACGMPAKK
ncbi:MAG: cupin domain-containing protein [Bacillota bacterium]